MKRSKNNKIIAGVCEGISKQTNINAWIIRILFLLIGGSICIYLAMWLFIDEE